MEVTSSDAETVGDKIYRAARDGLALTIYAILHNKNEQEVRAILDHETEENGQKTTPFLIAARNGHEGVVRILLTQYNVNIEQTGIVKFDGYTIEGATALWCSSGAGHFAVVQTLLELGANVNHPTCTNSTPLRAACFDGRLDIVRLLIDNKADITIPNMYDNTCLMIACYRGHLAVVTYLLEHRANPDAKAHCGATALHFSAERGHLDIIKELMKFKATMCLNDHGLSPLHIAAESSKADIVEFFISLESCDKRTQVEALELLGASYANDKDNYDIEKAYQYMWLAMQERFSNSNNILAKERLQPIPAYDNHCECTTVRELEYIRNNPDRIHMEALIVRERILGEDNAEIPHPVIFRGAVFADTAKFDRCTSLWLRAMYLRHKNNRSIAKDLIRFAQVFAQMIHVGVGVDFPIANKVFAYLLSELERDVAKVAAHNIEDRESDRSVLECNIHTALYLLVIMCKVKIDKTSEFELCKLVYRFNKMNLRLSKTGSTPLHMVADQETPVDNFHVNDIVTFPNAVLARLLIKCGSDINAVDLQRNTPLHLISRYGKPISDFLTLHSIMMALINAGAHVDMANNEGQTPIEYSTTGVAEIILRTQSQMSLKCFCAKAIKKQEIFYKGQLPTSLEEFVDAH